MSQPNWPPLSRYSCIFSCKLLKRSEGDRSSSTKSGHSGRNFCRCSGISVAKRDRLTHTASGARVAPLGRVKPPDEPKVTPVPSCQAHWGNDVIRMAARLLGSPPPGGTITKCSVSYMMIKLQGMAYNLAGGHDTVQYRLGGCITCLGPHLRFALDFLRTFCGKPAARCGARPPRICQSSDTSLSGCSTRLRTWVMWRQASAWVFRGVRFGVDASVGPRGTFPWRTPQDGGAGFFPPLHHALVKAVACELVAETKQPRGKRSAGAR